MKEGRLAGVKALFGRAAKRGRWAELAIGDEPSWHGPKAAINADRLLKLIAAVEETALSIYRAHGLPTRPGQYARAPRGKHWKFISEILSAEERWELFLANSDRGRWTFAGLEDLVSWEAAPSTDLERAATLLKTCREISSRLAGCPTASHSDEIASALLLGAEWRSLEMTLERARTGGLRLGRPSRLRAPKIKAS